MVKMKKGIIKGKGSKDKKLTKKNKEGNRYRLE